MASARAFFIFVAAALLTTHQAFAQGRPPGGGSRGGGGPTQVGVMVTAEQDVPYTVTLPGRAIAFQETSIRPQVGGEVLEIVYQPGHAVKTGDVLFRLDPATLAAALSAADAAVAGAEASLTSARNTVTRYRRLEGSGVSSVALSDAEVALLQAEANLKSAQAARDAAKLSLERTEITSPIDGMSDVPSVSVGDIVTANQSESLTTVTQLDPIYVDVSESSARMLRNRERIDSGNLITNGHVETQLTLETGEQYAGTGRIVSPGITVSPTTGTVPIRLQFQNAKGMILPGQFLRVEMTLGTTRAILVPQRATRRASDGTLTAFVAREGKAQQVTLSETGTHKNSWIVTQGIQPGEALILDGLQDLRVGAEITTVPVTIDSQGVVQNAEAATEAPAPAAKTAD